MKSPDFVLLITVIYENLDAPEASSAQSFLKLFDSQEEADVAYEKARGHQATHFSRHMTVTQVTKLY